MKELIIDSIKKHKIYVDPIRQEIINAYRQSENPLSVKMISDIINLPHSKVHYHTKKLLEIDALCLVKTDKINGIIQKYYALNFDVVNFVSSDDNNYKGEVFTSELTQAFKEKYDSHWKDISEAASKLNGLDNEKTYGIQLINDIVYLTEEERSEIIKLLMAYVEKHKYQKDNVDYATKTKLFCTIHDEITYSEDK